MRNLVLGILIGVLSAFIGAEIVGHTSAIAAPLELFQLLGSSLGSLIWDTFVVQVFGFGILSFILSFCVVKLFKLKWLPTVLCGFLASQVTLSALSGGTHLSLAIPIHHFLPHLAVVLIAFTFGGFTGSRGQDKN